MEEDRKSRRLESVLIGVAAAALIAVVLANVIRVRVSPDAAVATRAIFFGASWIAAVAWAAGARHRDALVWLGALAACGGLIAVCQAFAGSVSGHSLLYVIGPGGAGVGAALLIRRSLAGRPAWTACGAAFLGTVAAVWLAIEPGMELWKLLPNDWEVSKGLEYRWGIRMGEERARFLFDTPMEAGVVQWFLGSLCLAVAMAWNSGRSMRILFGAAAVLLYASVALTYSRAGIVLGILSIGLAGLILIRTRRATLVACILAGLTLPFVALVANRLDVEGSAAMRNLTSILDPAEEANRIRLIQLAKASSDLSQTPWHGHGAGSFVLFHDAPRMPEHESSPIGLVASFGVGGAALVLLFVVQLFRRRQGFFDVVVNKSVATPRTAAFFLVLIAGPLAIYSLIAPVLAGTALGMVCFTTFGLLAICDAPSCLPSGKP